MPGVSAGGGFYELRMVADLLGIEARVYGSDEKEGAHS